MMQFYSPKNFKQGRHIAGIFRVFDLIILIAAACICIPIALSLITSEHLNIFLLVLSLLPLLTVIFLVQPFPPVYHNILLYLQVLYLYLMKQKKYIWGGIVKYEEKIDDGK